MCSVKQKRKVNKPTKTVEITPRQVATAIGGFVASIVKIVTPTKAKSATKTKSSLRAASPFSPSAHLALAEADRNLSDSGKAAEKIDA